MVKTPTHPMDSDDPTEWILGIVDHITDRVTEEARAKVKKDEADVLDAFEKRMQGEAAHITKMVRAIVQKASELREKLYASERDVADKCKLISRMKKWDKDLHTKHRALIAQHEDLERAANSDATQYRSKIEDLEEEVKSLKSALNNNKALEEQVANQARTIDELREQADGMRADLHQANHYPTELDRKNLAQILNALTYHKLGHDLGAVLGGREQIEVALSDQVCEIRYLTEKGERVQQAFQRPQPQPQAGEGHGVVAVINKPAPLPTERLAELKFDPDGAPCHDDIVSLIAEVEQSRRMRGQLVGFVIPKSADFEGGGKVPDLPPGSLIQQLDGEFVLLNRDTGDAVKAAVSKLQLEKAGEGRCESIVRLYCPWCGNQDDVDIATLTTTEVTYYHPPCSAECCPEARMRPLTDAQIDRQKSRAEEVLDQVVDIVRCRNRGKPIYVGSSNVAKALEDLLERKTQSARDLMANREDMADRYRKLLQEIVDLVGSHAVARGIAVPITKTNWRIVLAEQLDSIERLQGLVNQLRMEKGRSGE
ncbi:MAG: hypothetical protein ACPGQD_03715 [Planctomycetota bacterium]